MQNCRTLNSRQKCVLTGAKAIYHTVTCSSANEHTPADGKGRDHHNNQENILQSRIMANRGGNLLFPLSHFTNRSDHSIHISQHSTVSLLTWESLQERYAGIQWYSKRLRKINRVGHSLINMLDVDVVLFTLLIHLAGKDVHLHI